MRTSQTPMTAKRAPNSPIEERRPPVAVAPVADAAATSVPFGAVVVIVVSWCAPRWAGAAPVGDRPDVAHIMCTRFTQCQAFGRNDRRGPSWARTKSGPGSARAPSVRGAGRNGGRRSQLLTRAGVHTRSR